MSSSWRLSWEQSWRSRSSSAWDRRTKAGWPSPSDRRCWWRTPSNRCRCWRRDVAALVDTVVDELAGIQDLLATSQAILDDVGVAAATNVADITEAAADVADRLARQLELIERFIPGDTQSVAEELRALADGLEPVADQLRTLGVQLQTAADQLGDTAAALADVAVQADAIAADIAELGPTLDALGATASDLRDRAQSASDRVDLDMWLVRILVIVTGVGIAVFGLITHRFAAALAAGTFAIPTAITPPTAAPSE